MTKPTLLLLTFIAMPLVAQDTTKLQPVVVTATRTPLAIGDLPASVTVLDGRDLRARGVATVSDALREVPGVSVVQSGSTGSLTSLFVRGGQSNYTKILIDGVPMNQAGGFFDLATLTTDNVERIEIVRGPSSVVWGSDAVTGVVNIITRSGRGANRLSVEGRAGSLGAHDADVELSRAAQAVTYSFGLAHHASEGIYSYNNQYGETVMSGRADAALDEKTSASFNLRYSDFNFHYPTNGGGTPTDSNQFDFANQLALGARIRRLVTNGLTLQASVASSSHDGGTNDDSGRGSNSFFQSEDHISRRSAEVRVIGNVGTGTVITAGGQVEEQAGRNLLEFGGGFSGSANFTVDRHEHAGFAEIASTASKLTATAGARVDGNKQFGSFGTFRVGAQYALADWLSLHANAGTAFREPSLIENFATGFATGNPDLKPEHTRSWEAGLGSAMGPGAVSLTWFDQRFVDMIDYNGAAAAGQPNYQNVAKASARGAEFQLHHEPVHGVFGDLSLTRLASKVIASGFDKSNTATLVEGQRLLRRPNLSGSFRLGYSGIRNLSLDAVTTYVGNRDDRAFHDDFTVADTTLAAYTLLDLSASYLLPLKDLSRPRTSLTFRASNVADVEYESVAGFRTPGRVLLFGVRVDY